MRALIAALALAGCAGGGSRSEPIEKQAAEKFPAGAADCSDAPVTAFAGLEAASGSTHGGAWTWRRPWSYAEARGGDYTRRSARWPRCDRRS